MKIYFFISMLCVSEAVVAMQKTGPNTALIAAHATPQYGTAHPQPPTQNHISIPMPVPVHVTNIQQKKRTNYSQKICEIVESQAFKKGIAWVSGIIIAAVIVTGVIIAFNSYKRTTHAGPR